MKVYVEKIRDRLNLNNMRECSQDRKLQWFFGHLERWEENNLSSKWRNLTFSARGQPRKTLNK